jgi:hypothetical protein
MVPTPETRGDIDAMCLPAGESVALIRRIRPAAEIVRSMAGGAVEALRRDRRAP